MANSAWQCYQTLQVMNHYWFLSRCLCCKAQSSLFKCAKLINHFSSPPICDRDLGPPLLGHFIWVQILRVCVCLCASEWITQDDELGFALDPHSCTRACSYLHMVLHSGLQTPNNHWTDGCVHRFIDMKPSFVGQTPDLTETDVPDRIHCKVAQRITNIYKVQSRSLPCIPGWCRSVGQRGEGPTTRWLTCYYGFQLSKLPLAVEAHWVLMGFISILKNQKALERQNGVGVSHVIFTKEDIKQAFM